MICSIPGCGKRHEAKGYCKAHYKRFCKHGDPFGGRTSQGEPMRFVHEVALLYTGEECLRWPFTKNAKGYGYLWIDGKNVRAHRYVCELAHGAPPTPDHEAAHNCGKGHDSCIAPGHLDWKTRAENEADKLIHGTHSRGERNSGAKLTEAAARDILALKGIETQHNLAKRFLVSPGSIANIHAGRRWAWLSAVNSSTQSNTKGTEA